LRELSEAKREWGEKDDEDIGDQGRAFKSQS